jgi:hypothetical protein
MFDGTHAPIQKKWMGSTNRDASQIIANRRTNSIGKGTFNLANKPTSFTSHNSSEGNTVKHALDHARSGGAVAPLKTNTAPSLTGVPVPGFHPYMQPGYKGKLPMFNPMFNDRNTKLKYNIGLCKYVNKDCCTNPNTTCVLAYKKHIHN